MSDLSLLCSIITMQSDGKQEADIRKDLLARGESASSVSDALDAIEQDDLMTIHTMFPLTPINPSSYSFGLKKIKRIKYVFFGLFRHIDEIAIRSIDRVVIYKNVFFATVSIVHSDKSEIVMDKISTADADKIQMLYGCIIEAQRKQIINIAED